jgi:4-hydroxythreonine-4-phosphate dehydrogenase
MTASNSQPGAPVRILITSGEPAGIGPDLILGLLNHPLNSSLYVVGDANLLEARAKELNLPCYIQVYSQDATALEQPAVPNVLKVIHIPLAKPVRTGVLDPANAQSVLDTLDYAVQACLAKQFDAMVTGPLHKGNINDAGIAFTGHTEYLAEQSASYPVMMLQNERMRVALATTHVPLKEVADAITTDLLRKVLTVIHQDLGLRFGIARPAIYICGLNPHAGEDGHLGREEIDIMIPVIEELKSSGMNLHGPLSADTLFIEKYLQAADVFLAMYHDQGLPVLKATGFGEAVNITLGLPFIRTSVDHGTALELAGTGKANVSSLFYAIQTAVSMAQNSRIKDSRIKDSQVHK